MNNMLTLSEVDALINTAISKGDLRHYNGGQAYIAYGNNVIIIDHACLPVTMEVHTGGWAESYLEQSPARDYTHHVSRLAQLHPQLV
jgi:acetyl esterase/lipase